MRLKSFLALAAFTLLTAPLLSKPFNEAQVARLNGTVMDQPQGGAAPFALQTGSTVQKGDILTCNDQSYVILKTHRGDLIGLNGYPGQTVVIIDEYYLEGPDRQIRLILQKGTLMLRTNNVGSRQSFFEINSGSVVSSIDETQAILSYDPGETNFKVQYLRGNLSVIDKTSEHKFGVEPKMGGYAKNVNEKTAASEPDAGWEYIPQGSEYNWKGGTLADKGPSPLDELAGENYKRFFDGQPPLTPADSNILLRGPE
jgi:hypothetical protein